MLKNNVLDFNFFIKILILLITLLLLEGIFHHYYFKISQLLSFIPYENQTGYNDLIWKENGIVEILQVLFLLFSIFFLIKFLKSTDIILTPRFKSFVFLYLLGVLYYFFEEISWGQHIFGWQSPEFFLEINTQNETNIHNTLSIFNELPRNLLLIWCSLSFLIIKVISSKNKYLNFFIYPSSKLRWISIIILLFFLPDYIIDKFNLAPGHPAENDKEIILNIFFEIISFNFIRLSELQELLFNTYIFWHSYFLIKANETKRFIRT